MPNERKLTKSELKKREDIVMDMKKNKPITRNQAMFFLDN